MINFLILHQTLLFLILMMVGTLSLSFSDIEIKKLLNKNIDEQFVLGISFALAGFFLFIPFIFIPLPEIKDGFWIATIGTVTLNIISQRVFFRALKLGDISLIAPLRLLTPMLVIITGYFFLQEIPRVTGMFGIILTLIGLWMLLFSDKPFSFKKLTQLKNEKGVLLGLLGATLFAISFPLDKKAIVASSALFASAVIFLSIGLLTLLLNSSQKKVSGSTLISIFKKDAFHLGLTSLWIAIGVLLTNQALSFSFAAYAASLKRLQAIWTIFLAGTFLQEKNIGKKIIATICIFIGILVMIIF
ncbi:MAG: DMT family transporter [Candidatus Paceibacterota bacterium]